MKTRSPGRASAAAGKATAGAARPRRSPPTALITGASSGIGAALAERLARAGHALVLVARSRSRLLELARELGAAHGVPVRVEATDLAAPGAAAALAARLARARVTVDVLVNNAGVLHQGRFADMPAGLHRQMLDLNVGALTDMLACFVPPMVARGRGRVLNVASIAAFQPIASLATYAATKAYVLSLSEALAEELDGTGVTVTALCPGITATAMLEGARAANARLGQLPAFMIGRVDDVADAALAACLAGRVICVPGAANQAAVLASRATPKWVVRRVGGLLARAAM